MYDGKLYECAMPDGSIRYLHIWFSDGDSEFDAPDQDAWIGYSIYDPAKTGPVDGGLMSYNSETSRYETLDDALDDVLEFAFDTILPGAVAESDKNPYDFEG